VDTANTAIRGGNLTVRKTIQGVCLGWCIVLGLSFLVPVTDAFGAENDLQRTWIHARVAALYPDGMGIAYFRMTAKGGKAFFERYEVPPTPVVVYMHGCTGFSADDRKVIKQIAEAGFVVVAPDSMARTYRPRQCSSRSKKGGAHPFVFDFRQAEINYALDNLWQQPWVDWDNLFLIGVSEGGLATAHYRGDYFRARVITQWTCNGAPLVQGISAPADTPILSVVQKNDPWYNTDDGKQNGHCGSYFGDRPNSTSIIIDGDSEHRVMKDEKVMERIISFLNDNLAPVEELPGLIGPAEPGPTDPAE
jgi:dienelactone hydrolase